uniref:Uncharacterized protein n=1 Tax=Anguilla anguilla TaxID=7936 RepID=A0A0E9PL36_ANGAN
MRMVSVRRAFSLPKHNRLPTAAKHAQFIHFFFFTL